jgi:hypothetical protein
VGRLATHRRSLYSAFFCVYIECLRGRLCAEVMFARQNGAWTNHSCDGLCLTCSEVEQYVD